jgi:ABC-type uncharacterized transport system permease subunit
VFQRNEIRALSLLVLAPVLVVLSTAMIGAISAEIPLQLYPEVVVRVFSHPILLAIAALYAVLILLPVALIFWRRNRRGS